MWKNLLKKEPIPLIIRLSIALLVVWILRIIFYLYNIENVHMNNITEELPQLFKGSLIFDASNFGFTFALFIVLSLLPFRFRASGVYQKVLFIYFIFAITLLVILNLVDTVYFHYVLKRVTIDEFSYFNNGNTSTIISKGIAENWYLFVIALLLIGGAIWLYKKTPYSPSRLSGKFFYPISMIVFLLSIGVLVIGIRGGVSRAIRPITLSNAAQFARSPQQSFVILNNPFCILKSMNNNDNQYTKYFDQTTLNQLYTPAHSGIDSATIRKDNIVIFVMESFSYEHSRLLNPDIYTAADEDYTPFLDSLMQKGFIFEQCYANGKKSIDALPSIIASIPSFKTPFTLTDQALSPINGLGTVLGKEGWDSWFFNGSENRSLGFVAFAKSAGYQNFRTRENYEEKIGKNDFDGYWGIWDEKFLSYMADELDSAKAPFLSTVFTLTNHHPFVIPEELKEKLPKGKTLAHKCVAYADYALRHFFAKAKTKDWYKNTIFVIVADHVGSEKYADRTKTSPGDSHIIYTIFTPDGRLQGRSNRVTQQIDIMPTLLGMIHYNKPYVAFGSDFFNEKRGEYAINYDGEKFRWITDSATYRFDEKTTGDSLVDERVKSFVQYYYMQMEKRDFTFSTIPYPMKKD